MVPDLFPDFGSFNTAQQVSSRRITSRDMRDHKTMSGLWGEDNVHVIKVNYIIQSFATARRGRLGSLFERQNICERNFLHQWRGRWSFFVELSYEFLQEQAQDLRERNHVQV